MRQGSKKGVIAKLEIVTLWSSRYLIAEGLLIKTFNRKL